MKKSKIFKIKCGKTLIEFELVLIETGSWELNVQNGSITDTVAHGFYYPNHEFRMYGVSPVIRLMEPELRPMIEKALPKLQKDLMKKN